MKKYIYLFSLALLSVTALPAFASVTTFKQLIEDVFISGMLRPLVPLLIGLAVVVFIYGVLVLMFSEEGDKREEGKKFMFWGIIGIFVMVSVWGLVAVLQSTFNLDSSSSISVSGSGSVAAPINNYNARDANGNIIYNYNAN